MDRVPRRALLWLVVAVGLAGCAGTGAADRPGAVQPSGVGSSGAGTAGAGDSGVVGGTVVDAGCPVLREATPCPERPLAARVIVLDASTQRRVTEVETGDDGRFRVGLPPGGYELRAENLTGGLLPVAQPVPVVVRAGEFTSVTVRFDSGVRAPAAR